MVRAISQAAGLFAFGAAAGTVLLTIGFMGWALYAVGALAVAVLAAALAVFALEMAADCPYCPSSAHRSLWVATGAAAVLFVVAMVI